MSAKVRRGKRSKAGKPAKPRVKGARPHANFMLSPLVAVERAMGDLRRGLPVVIAADGAAACVICASELATDDVLDAVERWTKASPSVVLTHNRASTLKIRLYTPGAVCVPLPPDGRARAARMLADPTRDMHDPLLGPWKASRDALAATTAASLRLAKLAEILPSVVEFRVSMKLARKLSDAHGLTVVRVADIDSHEGNQNARFTIVARAQLPLANAENTRVLAFRPEGGGREHLALVVGEPEPPGPVLIRLHSECLTGDLLGSLKCDCGDQLRGAIAAIGKEGSGILLYLAQEGRGIGLINKLKAYELQDQGFDTIDANKRLGFEADERRFAVAAEMLKYLGYSSVRLMTNNPDKVEALKKHGIEVVERVAHQFPTNPHNAAYLATKKAKSGHMI